MMAQTPSLSSWITWNQAQFNQSNTTSTTINYMYQRINQPQTSTSWIAWQGMGNQQGSFSVTQLSSWATWNAPVQLTHEQKAFNRWQAIWRGLADACYQLEKQEATERAEALLEMHLDATQIADLKAKKCFYVFVGDKRYRVDRGSTVKLLDEKGSIRRKYCIHPHEALPAADVMLAQKLLLEADEPAFLRIANAS